MIPPGLARKRRLAQAALWFEQVWPAIWPALGVVGLYAGLSLLDLPAYLPAWPRFVLAAAVLLAAVLLLWLGLRRITLPTGAMADRRLERDSALRHRPLAALADRPADPTPEQEALWQVHLSRLAGTIARLRVRRPQPGLARRDRFALRGGLVVFLAAAVTIAGADAPGRLERAFLPTLPTGPAGPGLQVQAWATPPAYTGLPPVLLHPDQPAPHIPVGAHLTASVTGTTATPSLAIAPGGPEPFRALDATSWQAEGDLRPGPDGAAHVEIRRGNGAVASWVLPLIPDLPPVPAWTEPPGPNLTAGRPTLQSRFAWQATDDYGVTGLQVELRLVGRPSAPAVSVTVPLAGAPKSARGVIAPDLSAHPWAGLEVVARLLAKDAPGQIGTSAPASFVLPAREFQNPAASALIAVRRQLSLTPDARAPATAVIDAIADEPDSVDNDTGVLLNLRALSALLREGHEPTTVDEAQSRLWTLALALEENAPERTAAALEQARQALRDAMDPNQPDKPEQAEIDRRVQELRDAIQKRMEALADQARRDDTPIPSDPNLPQMNARDLDRLAQQLQQSLKDGKTEDAQRQMAELEKLLDALKNARPETGEEREQRRAEARQKGRDQMDVVQDMIGREGQVLDNSTQRAGNPAQPQSQQQSQSPSGDARGKDARTQSAMRRALGELMQRYGDLTGDIPAPLGEADTAMREAGQALAAGRDEAASTAAKRAIEALQKGGQQMGQQLAQQFGTGQGGAEGEEGQGQDGDGTSLGGDPNGHGTGRTMGPPPGSNPGSGQRRAADRDPLGRPLGRGTSGHAESGDIPVPDQMEQARTREIQDELRRRGADRTRKADELDYIDRLLKPF